MYNILKTTEQEIKSINEKFAKTRDIMIKISEDKFSLQTFSDLIYSKHSDAINNILNKQNEDGKLSISLSYDNFIMSSMLYKTIKISNKDSIGVLKYDDNKKELPEKLAALAIFYKMPHKFLSFEDAVRYSAINQDNDFFKYKNVLNILWRHYDETKNSNEYIDCLMNNYNFTKKDKDLCLKMWNYMTSEILQYITIEYNKFEFNHEKWKETPLIVPGELFVSTNGDMLIKGTFPVSRDLADTCLGTLSNKDNDIFAYINYDNFLVEIPIWKIFNANAANKTIYVKLDEFFDGIWELTMQETNAK